MRDDFGPDARCYDTDADDLERADALNRRLRAEHAAEVAAENPYVDPADIARDAALVAGVRAWGLPPETRGARSYRSGSRVRFRYQTGLSKRGDVATVIGESAIFPFDLVVERADGSTFNVKYNEIEAV